MFSATINQSISFAYILTNSFLNPVFTNIKGHIYG